MKFSPKCRTKLLGMIGRSLFSPKSGLGKSLSSFYICVLVSLPLGAAAWSEIVAFPAHIHILGCHR